MKSKIFLLTILISFFLHSQMAVPVTFKKVSQNGLYTLTVKGRYYEGFSGGVVIDLKTKGQKRYWRHSINEQRNFVLPVISNKGTAALLYDGKTEFFNIKGRKISEFNPDSGWVMYYDTEEFIEPLGCFSEDDSSYFDFIKKSGTDRSESVWLFATSLTSNLKWKVDTELTMPNYVTCQQNNLFVISGEIIKLFSASSGEFLRYGIRDEIKGLERKNHVK